MIILSFRALGCDTVLSFNPNVSWTSWQFSRSGKDTDVYLGKIEFALTNHWKLPHRAATKVVAVSAALCTTIAATMIALPRLVKLSILRVGVN